MSKLYGRKVEFYADQKLLSGDDFTIYFEVPFDVGSDANISEVNIYNLKDETINEVKKGSKVVLNAGYVDDAGSILLGEARKIYTEWTGVNKITTVAILDGFESWFKTNLKKTYKENITAKQILNDILSMTGLEIGAFNLPKNKVYKGGKSVNATIKGIIEQISRDCGAKAHVNKGKVFIRPRNEGDNIGFILDSKHGLVSSPTLIEKEEKGKTLNGYKVRSLLNHRITVDSLLEIKSKTANGIFKVESGKHFATGSSFYTELEVYPV